MLALVTGGNGFIGSHLVEHLLQRGYSVRCLVRKTSNLQWLKNFSVEYVYGDLFDNDALKNAVQNVDLIFHSAGITKAKTKEEYFRGNQFATRNFLEQVLQHNPNIKRFVHVSSQAAVGPSFSETPIDESVPFHPITTYGKSKMEAEKECQKFFDRFPITICRPPAVFGERDKDVFEFFKTMNSGIQPTIGFNQKKVSLIHVSDVVDGIILAGESANSDKKTYFISSEQTYTWEEIGTITSRILGKKAFRIVIPESIVIAIFAFGEIVSRFSSKPSIINLEKAKDITQQYWTCSVENAKRDLGFRQRLSLEEGIRKTVQWYRNAQWLK
ncbi:MAG: SDR family NAD(P)-dependent oxidoreductase [Ignavibacteria bacterium]|nr:SDR family NAD(P)-dependent oxidoreductase [Ignavibacteria bacterium]